MHEDIETYFITNGITDQKVKSAVFDKMWQFRSTWHLFAKYYPGIGSNQPIINSKNQRKNMIMKILKQLGVFAFCIGASFIHTGSLWELSGVTVCIVIATMLAYSSKK